MTSMAQKPRETPARVEVQGSSHQATVCGQPYRYLLPEHTQRKIFTVRLKIFAIVNSIVCHLTRGVYSWRALTSSH